MSDTAKCREIADGVLSYSERGNEPPYSDDIVALANGFNFLLAEVGRLREFLQEAFPYIPQTIELARQIRAEFSTVEGVNRE